MMRRFFIPEGLPAKENKVSQQHRRIIINNNKMNHYFVAMILLSSCYTEVRGMPAYQNRIPNGNNVISPSGEPWPAVGHYRSGGGGARNSFGQDFAAAGFQWTMELCQKDSDCDGFTNGQELGDPDCLWTEGDIPQFDTGITHPGIADTERSSVVGSANPSGKTTTCSDFSFSELPSNHINTSFVMPNYMVPTKRTTYAKYAIRLDLEEEEDAFVVRFSPIIQNREVVHHIILYHCHSEPTDFISSPNTQGKMPCSEFISAWAVGGKEQCMPPKVGMELDSSKPWYILDVHYDNPQSLSGIQDNSGLMLTHYPKSSASSEMQVAGYMRAGASMSSIAIPPRRNVYEISAECSFPNIPPEGIAVFTYILHAHQLGRKIWTQVDRKSIRLFEDEFEECPSDCVTRGQGNCNLCFTSDGCCGSWDDTRCRGNLCCSDCTLCAGCEACYPKTNDCNPNGFDETITNETTMFDLGCDTRYDFDLQEARPLSQPQTLFSTDVLTTHCVFNSSERTALTRGGDASEDEMCIGFFLYYPKQPNMNCMANSPEVGVGDGQHVCQMPNQQPVVNDSMCHPDSTSSKDNFGSTQFFNLDTWLQIHILLMFLSMGLLLPVGVLMAVSFRSNNKIWFRYHKIIVSCGIILMMMGLIAAFVGMQGIHLTVLHHKLGLTIMILVLLQPINALWRPPRVQKHRAHLSSEEEEESSSPPHHQSNTTSKARYLWELFHKTIGRVIIVVSWVNIFVGIRLLESYYGSSENISRSLIVIQSFVIIGITVVAGYRRVQSPSQQPTPDDDNHGEKPFTESDNTSGINSTIGKQEGLV